MEGRGREREIRRKRETKTWRDIERKKGGES